MNAHNARNLVFRRASYSGSSGNCVEVADTPDVHAVRDSKTPEQSPLFFDRDEWANFVTGIRNA